jgi:uncharacterized protein (DUF1697 family)
MPGLRDALTAAGFEGVRTYLHSGNVVLDSDSSPAEVTAASVSVLKATFGHDVEVLLRTAGELADVVKGNPLGDVAVEPKRYIVTFLSEPAGPAALDRLRAAAAPQERLAVIGREIYSWHPPGVARLTLWEKLGSINLGVTASSRNWNTVLALLAMCATGAGSDPSELSG